jgi:hypothetical protein
MFKPTFLAMLLLAIAIPCYGQSAAQVRQARKQWLAQQQEAIRKSGFDKNHTGRLSATERKKYYEALKEQMREAEKRQGKK